VAAASAAAGSGGQRDTPGQREQQQPVHGIGFLILSREQERPAQPGFFINGFFGKFGLILVDARMVILFVVRRHLCPKNRSGDIKFNRM